MTLQLPNGNWMDANGNPVQPFHHWADQMNRDVERVRELTQAITDRPILPTEPPDPGDPTPEVPDTIVGILEDHEQRIITLEEDYAALIAQIAAMKTLAFYTIDLPDARNGITINHGLGTSEVIWCIQQQVNDVNAKAVEGYQLWVIDDNNIWYDWTNWPSGGSSFAQTFNVMGLV